MGLEIHTFGPLRKVSVADHGRRVLCHGTSVDEVLRVLNSELCGSVLAEPDMCSRRSG